MLSKGLNKLALSGGNDSPTDRDYIDHLDYEELEEKYCVHKYYPQYIHNVDASTPMIKELIGNKPIYAQANRHVKKKKRQEDRQERKEEKKAQREEKKEQHKERKELRDAQRQERRHLREDQLQRLHSQKLAGRPCELASNIRSQQQAYPRHIAPPNGSSSSQTLKSKNEKGGDSYSEQPHLEDDFVFRNPFGAKPPPTFEESQAQVTRDAAGRHEDKERDRSDNRILVTRMRRSSTQSNNKRHNSIATRFVSILKGNNGSSDEATPDSPDNDLLVSRSYDATKSNMTSSRSKKTTLLKLKFDPRRRMSENIGKLL